MTTRPNVRRLAVLLGVIIVVGGVAVWRFTGGGASRPDEAAAAKAQELTDRYEATGLSTEVQEDDAGGADEVTERGPQSPDD